MPPAAVQPAQDPPAPDPPATAATADYRHRLRSTPHGWPVLPHWCVWVEPAPAGMPADLWQQRWQEAVSRALDHWRSLLSLELVESPDAAHVRLFRRRPPLRGDREGRGRASHGRATLRLVQVDRGAGLRLEPWVEVLISPAQRSEAMEATALHELGHAFGLWGHSDDPRDAMAVSPGPQPVRSLTARDRATLRWLYSQPSRFGQPLPSP